MIRPRPISELPSSDASAIRFVLFDIDDTITENGLLSEASFSTIWALRRSGLVPIPVTGRPAGWCDLIARQWPVGGVIGENGAFAFFMDRGVLRSLYHPSAPPPNSARNRLYELAEDALHEIPGLRFAKDQAYRVFDVALDFAEEQPRLGLDSASRVKAIFEKGGAHAKISSIHVNAWLGDYDKLSMAEFFLSSIFAWDPILSPRAVLYFGDSPNDEPMFGRFELSCGVANMRRFESIMERLPAFITEASHGAGFAEGCAIVLKRRLPGDS